MISFKKIKNSIFDNSEEFGLSVTKIDNKSEINNNVNSDSNRIGNNQIKTNGITKRKVRYLFELDLKKTLINQW